MAHLHPHSPSSDAVGTTARYRQRARRLTLAVLVPATLATVLAMIWLWPTPLHGAATPDQPANVTGTVNALDTVPCPPVDPGTPASIAPAMCGSVILTLLDGPQQGTVITAEFPSGPGAATVKVGDTMVLMYLQDSSGGSAYQILDHKRSTQLWLIAAAFILAVVAFGRLRGFTALIGLVITFAVVLKFIVPALLAGTSPMLVAIVGSAAIMLVVLYLTHGFTLSTSVAVAGTLASLILTGVLSSIAVAITHLTGISDEQTTTLTIYYDRVDMRGLLLAGILIGSLGVLDDVTVTQAATVSELAHANSSLGVFGLYRAATRVGRAHIAAVINTLILAYAGTSLPLLISFAASDMSLGTIVNEQLMAQELVRGAVGTIGLVAAVPITTILAAWCTHRLAAEPEPSTSDIPIAAPVRDGSAAYTEALLTPHAARNPWQD